MPLLIGFSKTGTSCKKIPFFRFCNMKCKAHEVSVCCDRLQGKQYTISMTLNKALESTEFFLLWNRFSNSMYVVDLVTYLYHSMFCSVCCKADKKFLKENLKLQLKCCELNVLLPIGLERAIKLNKLLLECIVHWAEIYFFKSRRGRQSKYRFTSRDQKKCVTCCF